MLGFGYNQHFYTCIEACAIMVRILILIILVCLFYAISKRFFAFLTLNDTQSKSKQAADTVEKIVKCAYCGTHIPESEAMQANIADSTIQLVCKNQPCAKIAD